MPNNSPYLEEIIEKKPNWLIRFGISSILLLLLSLLFVAWLVKYPDIITATIYISTPSPPIDLVCPTNAQIEELFVNENESHVIKDSPIVLLKSTASYKEVQKLQEFLRILTKESLLENKINSTINLSKLGELQNTYNQLSTYLEKHNEHIQNKPYEKRIILLKQIIEKSIVSFKISKTRFSLELQEKVLVEKNKVRADTLFFKGVIADQEWERFKQIHLQKEMQLEANRAGLAEKQIAILNLQEQLTELEIQENNFNLEILENIKNTTKTLNAQIEQWFDKYVISAPIEGEISIFSDLNKGDYLTAGSYILTILPIKKQNLFAYGSFPVEKAGKLKLNNKAIIKLHSYPYREFGSIDGYIEKISDFPIKNMYSVKIRLPNKLETGYNNKIIFKQRLTGEAELITENRSLLNRIFNNFKYFIGNQSAEE